MPYSRQRPRIAPNGRVAIRLTTAQRDMFIQSGAVPKELGHVLHRAPVRAGKLSLRVTRGSLEALIAAASRHESGNREEERAVVTLLRYLEGLEERFEEPETESEDEESYQA